jgi:hypothetical protein
VRKLTVAELTVLYSSRKAAELLFYFIIILNICHFNLKDRLDIKNKKNYKEKELLLPITIIK